MQAVAAGQYLLGSMARDRSAREFADGIRAQNILLRAGRMMNLLPPYARNVEPIWAQATTKSLHRSIIGQRPNSPDLGWL